MDVLAEARAFNAAAAKRIAERSVDYPRAKGIANQALELGLISADMECLARTFLQICDLPTTRVIEGYRLRAERAEAMRAVGRR